MVSNLQNRALTKFLGVIIMRQIQQLSETLMRNIQTVIVGKDEVVRLLLISLLCQGHMLLEDVPGMGKTVLVRTLAKSLGCTFKRIQFTPDLLPSDVLGVSIYNQKTGDFEFKPGPITAQIVLADEINRTSPRTQASLLECMEEEQITVDGISHPLPRPFMILATQNPVEYEGTFPLPEAQLDRFLIKANLGYPTYEEEIAMLERLESKHPISDIDQVIDLNDLSLLQKKVREVHINDAVKNYIVLIVQATRNHSDILLGASPRGSLALMKTSKALAAISGRDYVIPDDVKAMAPFVLSHRITLNPEAYYKGKKANGLVSEIVAHTPVA